MKLHTYIVGAILSIVLLGCANPTVTNAVRIANREAESTGSSSRYRVGPGGQSIEKYEVGSATASIPSGSTAADATLKADILRDIGKVESSKGGSASPKLLGVDSRPKSATSVEEVWVVDRRGRPTRYQVTLSASPRGADYQIQGPL